MKELIGFVLSTSVMLSCSFGNKKNAETTISTTEINAKSIASAMFNADSAYHYIEKQLSFGVRTPGSDAHKACGDWLVRQLSNWGYEVLEQSFAGKNYYKQDITGRNIIASLLPDKAQRILLMAHWDTRAVADEDPDRDKQRTPIVGADDGASGVAVLLELARQWSLTNPSIGIDIVFFDLEDGGHTGDNDSWCLGSQYWATNPHKSPYRAQGGILLDMVGAKGARFHWEGYSKSYAAPLMMDLWETAEKLGYSSYFRSSEGGVMVDDHVPVIEKLRIPCVDIINYSQEDGREGFASHWHTHNDNISIIDKETLRAVGETVATYIQKQ